MKHFVLLFFIIFCDFYKSFSQVNGTANFELTIVSKKGIHNRTENYILYFNNTTSIEFIQNSHNNILVKNDSEVTETKVLKINSGKRFIFKDFNKKKLILRTGIDVNSYLINDTLSNFKWYITKDKRKIRNFSCTKAITSFRGRKYIAWFTEEIPIQNGPWKFSGLPGFIVSVRDEDNSFIFELKGIDLKSKFNSNIISLPTDITSGKLLSHNQFMRLYNRKVDDFAKMSRVQYKDGNGVYSRTISLPEILERY